MGGAFFGIAATGVGSGLDEYAETCTGCSALVPLLLSSILPQMTTKAAWCLALLGGVSIKSMCLSVVQYAVNAYSRPSFARRSFTACVVTLVPLSFIVFFCEGRVEDTRAKMDVQLQTVLPFFTLATDGSVVCGNGCCAYRTDKG